MTDHFDPQISPKFGVGDRSADEATPDRSHLVLDEFAASLVQHVRDQSVIDVLAALRSGGVGAANDGWATELDERERAREVARAIVPDVVDLVVTNLLDAIDRQLLSLELTDEASGASVPLSRRGGLAGSYLAKDGWRTRFSSTISGGGEPDAMGARPRREPGMGERFAETFRSSSTWRRNVSQVDWVAGVRWCRRCR